MARSLVMTIIGPDRPGLVEELAAAISAHQGNWLESRMAQLAGNFAGILRVECPDETSDALVTALKGLSRLDVHVEEQGPPPESTRRLLRFDVIGNDRPGIIRQVAAALAKAGGNVEELSSNLESAPHAGHPVFHATGTVGVPGDVDESALVRSLEALSDDLSVSVSA
ncbi:MAG: glycine cleavage system protein R [Akkermansiaceae bacterium]|nr:glycine cleavage system protein R [Akkermansiaceae bacterium]NNM29505.1 glycine cleavage system protein R [Akkermansiaceae bacterium]